MAMSQIFRAKISLAGLSVQLLRPFRRAGIDQGVQCVAV